MAIAAPNYVKIGTGKFLGAVITTDASIFGDDESGDNDLTFSSVLWILRTVKKLWTLVL